MRGGYGHLVLIIQPVLAVNGDDGIDDILCSLREHILISNVDDGRFHLVQTGREGTLDAVGHRIDIGTGYIEDRSFIILDKLRERCRLIYLDLTQWGADNLSNLRLQLAIGIYWGTVVGSALEVANLISAVRMKLELEASALLIGETDEIYGDREVVAIECLLMVGAVDGLIFIELQSLTGLEENGW